MPRIDYHSPIQLLVAVRGHPFDRNAFAALFEGMEGIAAVMVDQPAAAALMNPEGMRRFDALLLYDMPGIDLAERRLVAPDEGFRSGFEALLREGKGVVALHHAIAGWPSWDSYSDYLGGRFLYLAGEVRGRSVPDSGYLQNVSYRADVVAADHPVTAGLPPSFGIDDELYLSEVFEEGVTPLLRAHHPFDRDHFYSAELAINGRLHEREGWSHAPGSSLIGWCKKALASPLVYLQPGDGPQAYSNPHYRRLVENAIRWVVSPEARL